MQAAEILQHVEAVGGKLWLEGETLKVRLPESCRPMVAMITSRKPEIICLLFERSCMPRSLRLIRWQLKEAPVRVSQCETVIDVALFIRSTLLQVDARLHGRGWMAGNWTLSSLIERLAAVGCHVALDDGKAALQ